MSALNRYERNRLDIKRRINNEKKVLRNREANKQDEQNVKAIENSVKQIQQDFESEVKALARNINPERLRTFTFLRVSGRNTVTIAKMPTVSQMNGFIKQLRNAAPTTANSRNSIQREATEFAAQIRSDQSQVQ